MSTLHIIILGDSISEGYAPLVRQRFGADVIVENFFTGDSARLLRDLESSVESKNPRLVLFNAGLHDLRFYPERQAFQQAIPVYEANLHAIIAWLRAHTDAILLWATTTPVVTERMEEGEFYRYMIDVQNYNKAAQAIVDEAGISTVDLYAVIVGDSIPDCIDAGGVHMTERGNRLLADAVYGAMQQLLK